MVRKQKNNALSEVREVSCRDKPNENIIDRLVLISFGTQDFEEAVLENLMRKRCSNESVF